MTSVTDDDSQAMSSAQQTHIKANVLHALATFCTFNDFDKSAIMCMFRINRDPPSNTLDIDHAARPTTLNALKIKPVSAAPPESYVSGRTAKGNSLQPNGSGVQGVSLAVREPEALNYAHAGRDWEGDGSTPKGTARRNGKQGTRGVLCGGAFSGIV